MSIDKLVDEILSATAENPSAKVTIVLDDEQPYDRNYWGPGGIDISRWGNQEVMRGAAYRDSGPSTDGAKNQRRSISSGRKPYRGMASDGIKETK